uniref:Uncharacterized protein n=1 Tax=Picea sitchensis TaxID=3332 RepID=A9NL50_PICSI|nr:unknown [Picea sitchensis]
MTGQSLKFRLCTTLLSWIFSSTELRCTDMPTNLERYNNALYFL